ncbi:MAG TPA: hypothetical protein VK846_15910 [Candidatus Limnocylindria bacterium]|nr:hypothetical protein [Candidatus Limnocylindria bacterium]
MPELEPAVSINPIYRYDDVLFQQEDVIYALQIRIYGKEEMIH